MPDEQDRDRSQLVAEVDGVVDGGELAEHETARNGSEREHADGERTGVPPHRGDPNWKQSHCHEQAWWRWPVRQSNVEPDEDDGDPGDDEGPVARS